jgi:AraC-like DNA-binding protein
MIDFQPTTPRITPQLQSSTDPFDEVLQLLQLTGVLYCRAELTEPWGLEIPAIDGVMTLYVVTSGHCWIELDGQVPVFLPESSLAMVPRTCQHKLRSDPAAATRHITEVPVELVTERFERMHFGGGGKLTRIAYCGVRFDHVLADRLVNLLPDLLHVRTLEEDDGWLHNTVRFISREAQQMLPGNETVIARLADILVIQAMRTWIESMRDGERGWIAALYDRQVGRALALLHAQPGSDWSVVSLAREVGMSRSGFSARFTSMLGEPVLHYLTHLRMQLAQRELRQTNDTLAKIAARVGYHSEPAFNRAFKRVMGVPPGTMRRRQKTITE